MSLRQVEIFASAEEVGAAAALDAARIIVATGNSQIPMIRALVEAPVECPRSNTCVSLPITRPVFATGFARDSKKKFTRAKYSTSPATQAIWMRK